MPTVGENAATSGINAAIGLVTTPLAKLLGIMDTDKEADDRQFNQQARLQGLQINGAKELAQTNKQNQLDIWNETSYQAQMKNMEAAGLNPALMYGGSGGGGTTGASTVTTPTGGQASDAASTENADTQKMNAGMGMALMLGQQKVLDTQAQKNEADANLSNTQATKIAGADTDVANATAQSLTQGIQNQRALQRLTEIQGDIAEVAKTVQTATTDDQILKIVKDAQVAESIARSTFIQADIDSATAQTKVNQIRQDYANAILQGAAMKSNIQLTQAQTQGIITGIQQKWQEINQNGDKNNMEHNDRVKAITEYTTNALQVAGIQAGGQIAQSVIKIAFPETSVTDWSDNQGKEGWSQTTKRY